MLELLINVLRTLIGLMLAAAAAAAVWVIALGVPKILVASIGWLWIPAVLVGAYFVAKWHHHRHRTA